MNTINIMLFSLEFFPLKNFGKWCFVVMIATITNLIYGLFKTHHLQKMNQNSLFLETKFIDDLFNAKLLPWSKPIHNVLSVSIYFFSQSILSKYFKIKFLIVCKNAHHQCYLHFLKKWKLLLCLKFKIDSNKINYDALRQNYIERIFNDVGKY